MLVLRDDLLRLDAMEHGGNVAYVGKSFTCL
jgi:hypothetical protein